MKNKAVKISDIAKTCGVSTFTVSSILSDNGRHKFKPETVDKVKLAAEELNYRHNPMAINLRRQKNDIIIGIMGNYLNHSDIELMNFLKKSLHRRGYYLTIQFSYQMSDEEKVDFFRKIYRWGAGLAITSTGVREDSPSYPAMSELLRKSPPSICFSPGIPAAPADYIGMTWQKSYSLIGDYFKSRKRKRILYCFNAENDERGHNFLDQLQDYGIQLEIFNASLQITGADFYRVGVAAAELLLSRPRSEMPDGIYCDNDDAALTLRECLTSCGINIPKDVLMVGGGDSSFYPWINPPMAVLVHDFAETAELAAADLVSRIEAGEIMPGTRRCIGTVAQRIIEPPNFYDDLIKKFKSKK